MLRPRSLSARLAVLVALGASVALGLCLTLLYVAMDSQLRAALDAGLVERSHDLEAAVEAGDPEILSQDTLAQLYTSDGTLLAGSAHLGGRRLLSAQQVQAVTDEAFDNQPLTPGAHGPQDELRLLSRPIESGDRVLTVGVSAQPAKTAQDRLLTMLFLAAPLLVALLTISGWLLVRATLRPVDQLTREAAAISSLDTDRRLPVVSGTDEIARLARTLEDMLARLRVVFARERAFVDDASHELRTPIAILQGELELALSGPALDAETEISLRSALREASRLTRLTEELLLLARERTGDLLATREPVDLLELLRDHGRSLAPVTGLRISVHGDQAVVPADPDRLRQVLSNLARNSAEAGATELRIDLGAGPSSVDVQIADDGPGLAPSMLDSAFERFTRGDDARTQGASGAGLGLAIVRAIIAAHGGVAEARNGPPLGGAVVTIRLPAR